MTAVYHYICSGRAIEYSTPFAKTFQIIRAVLLEKVRLEICVQEDKMDQVVESIATGARTGHEGDGVIFALDTIRGLRIRKANHYSRH